MRNPLHLNLNLAKNTDFFKPILAILDGFLEI